MVAGIFMGVAGAAVAQTSVPLYTAGAMRTLANQTSASDPTLAAYGAGAMDMLEFLVTSPSAPFTASELQRAAQCMVDNTAVARKAGVQDREAVGLWATGIWLTPPAGLASTNAAGVMVAWCLGAR
jgi:hypothetical protein